MCLVLLGVPDPLMCSFPLMRQHPSVCWGGSSALHHRLGWRRPWTAHLLWALVPAQAGSALWVSEFSDS